jgi:hypothetical protein
MPANTPLPLSSWHLLSGSANNGFRSVFTANAMHIASLLQPPMPDRGTDWFLLRWPTPYLPFSLRPRKCPRAPTSATCLEEIPADYVRVQVYATEMPNPLTPTPGTSTYYLSSVSLRRPATTNLLVHPSAGRLSATHSRFQKRPWLLNCAHLQQYPRPAGLSENSCRHLLVLLPSFYFPLLRLLGHLTRLSFPYVSCCVAHVVYAQS